ncbi:hypothetical protein FS749_014156, partial [Ceratobasidium sp. UAMH 11750]
MFVMYSGNISEGLLSKYPQTACSTMAATKENPIIFYDLVGKDGISWSPNTYKTRLTLNYKGLPYRVEMISFPDIQAKYKELGVTSTPYTLP